MARIGSMLGVSVLLVISGVVQATPLSPTANFIKTRPYQQLSTKDPIGTILVGDIDKASGIIPSVGSGLVVWADGRGGRVGIMGYDLTDTARGEFLISDETDDWQEGNPFAGYNGVGGYRWTVYDAAEVTTGSGDTGDIQGSNITPAPTWLFQGVRRQRSPVFTNVPIPASITVLSWMDYPGSVSDFVGHENTDIYTATVNEPIATPLPGLKNITLGKPAPRDSLAADGRYLTWQELRYDDLTEITHWDVVVYDLGGTYASDDLRFRTIDAPVAGRNQIAPDISGDLVVFTQVEDPSGLIHPTNIYFQDLSSVAGAVAITTTGTATNAAISRKDGNYFVVWQDYRLDPSTTTFPGGNTEDDFNWDIWGQEISIDSNGDWALHGGGPFLIRADAGRQTNPDIDGVDVVWQTQAPATEDIYVWGPIPEPCTALVVAAAAPFVLAVRRKRRRQKK